MPALKAAIARAGAGRERLPIDAAPDIAAALETVPRDKRAEFVEIVARELGVNPSWVYLRTKPFRRRMRAYRHRDPRREARGRAARRPYVALMDEMARERGVNRATVYVWIQPFRPSVTGTRQRTHGGERRRRRGPRGCNRPGGML